MNNAALSGKGEFERFRAALPRRFGDKVVASWFSDLECEDMSDDCVVLSTGSQFSCDAISQRFGPQLKETWGLVIRPVRKLSIVARQQMREDARRVEALKGTLAAASPLRAKAEASALKGAERRSSGIDDLYSPVDERATFETFAVDETNEMAFAAARQIFAPGANADVTYLNGPSGVGKSHLLFAIANEHRRRFGDGACAYITYHALQNGTVNAVFTNNIIALQKDLLSKEVLLIDDIHLLSTSPRTQAELLNLVNAAMASGRRLVIAGELTPQKLIAANFNERLADRLSGGLSVSLLPGDVAHRARVLKKRLEMNENSQRIEDSAVDYIAENFPQSLREAIGALKQLQLAHIGRDEPIGRLEAEKALRTRAMETRRAPSFDEAAGAVAAAFGLTPEEFRSRGQHQRLVRARHVFVIICRENLHESFPRIAKYMGRDHTTMMSGYKRGQALIERDRKLQEQLSAAREALGLARL